MYKKPIVEFKGIQINENEFIPAIFIDGEDDAWFDQSGVDKDKLERILLLVKCSYDLGQLHLKEEIKEL